MSENIRPRWIEYSQTFRPDLSNPVNRRMRFLRAPTSGKPDGRCKEDIKQNFVEVKPADLEKDAKAIANIFNEPNVIEHLSGIAPADTEKNINKFKKNIGMYIPEEWRKKLTEEALKRTGENMFMATPEEVKAYYTRLGTNAEVYVAIIGGKVVGTATLEKPGHAASMTGFISKVAVSASAPKVLETTVSGKGIARQLIQKIDDRLIALGCNKVEATIIRHLDNRELGPLDLFKRQGYGIVGIAVEGTMAWNIATGKFEFRDQFKMEKKLLSSA